MPRLGLACRGIFLADGGTLPSGPRCSAGTWPGPGAPPERKVEPVALRQRRTARRPPPTRDPRPI